MSRVMYNGSRLIPSPLVNINKQYTRNGNGDIIGKLYTLSITGTIIAYMGSPTSTRTFWTAAGYPPNEVIGDTSRLSSIQRKQEAIRQLFSTEGLVFEYQALDGTQTVQCNPRVVSIEFAKDIWYDRCEYTINLESDELYPQEEDTYSQYISAFSENWSFDTDEGAPEGDGKPRTYKLSHSVSATGKKFYESDGTLLKEAWQSARDYVLPKLGFDVQIALASGVANLPSYYTGYNHIRTNNQNESEGSYEVTENWIIASGTAMEEYTINKTDSLDDPYIKVGIDGTITGYEQRDVNLGLVTSKYTNALAKFTTASTLALTRAQTYSGVTLNIAPLRNVVGRNPIGGTITYSYEYDTRPTIITGARSVNVSVNDSLQGQLHTEVFVLGRVRGPVMQDLSASPATKRSLNIEVLMPVPSWGDKSSSTIRALLNNNPRMVEPTKTEINNIINSADPSGSYTTYFKAQPQENWNVMTGSYSYSVEFTFE